MDGNGYDYDLICIGSGPAGQRAAVQAAKLGKRVAVIERRRIVGGVCVDTGTMPSKTLREAVLYFMRRGGRFAPQGKTTERPTAKMLLSQVDDVIAREVQIVADQLRRNHIDLIHGEASFADPHTIRVIGEGGLREYTAAYVLIACGTRPAVPPGVDIEDDIVTTSDGILRIGELPRSLVVVGGGVIGIEYACMFAALSIDVTVVEKREHALDFVDREIVDELVHQMRNRGVKFRFGDGVESVDVAEGPPRRAVVRLESGKVVVGNLVLFSAGRIAATDRLNLEALEVAPGPRGRLRVDERFRTDVSHVYAAGDVIGHPALAATSSEQGRLVACDAFGVPSSGMSPHYPVGIYAIPELSTVGRNEQELTEARVPYEVGIARYREIARGHILGDDSGMVKLLFHRDDRKLLGVHAIGTGASELIHIGQAVLRLEAGLDYFMETVFNYPTLAECYKVAAFDAYNKLETLRAVERQQKQPEPQPETVLV